MESRSKQRAEFHVFLDSVPKNSATSHELTGAIGAEQHPLGAGDVVQDCLILVDEQGQIRAVSDLAEKMFGYRGKDLIGEPAEKLIAERSRRDYVHHCAQASGLGARPTGTGLALCARRRDGSEFPIMVSLSPIETDKETLLSNTIRDLSNRIGSPKPDEFEQAISRLSKLFTNLAINSIDGELTSGLKALADVLDLDRVSIILTDPDDKSAAISHWWVREGVPPPPAGNTDEHFPWLTNRIANHEIFCASAPEDLPGDAAAEREYMLSAGLKSWLAIPLRAGGEQLGRMSTGMFRRWQKWDSRLISRFQQAGDIFAGALARKRAAEARNEIEERFRIIADTAPVMIWICGTNKGCTFVNQSWLTFTGRTMEQEVGEGWTASVHPDDVDRCVATFHKAVDTRAQFRMEYRARRADGKYRWLADHGVPRFESQGIFVGYIGSCVDITDRMLSEEALRETTERLASANEQIAKLNERLERENTYLREEVKVEHHHRGVIGDSEGIQRLLKQAEQVAPTDSMVLLLGETGTGKELIARTIHELSRRKGHVMVKVNCAALPASLVESELFGREKGAFTGALTREIGRFELANGSTILLDEIGELPIELQSKLLRVLQEGEFERLGGPRTIKVDVRVIAATSRNLQVAVREGKFREDLFYRLNVFPMTVPPLRERREDIPPLVWHFVSDLSQRMGRSIETIDRSTMEAFKTYYWPGNVRELRNVIERFLITSTNREFRAELPAVDTGGAQLPTQTFEEVERSHILHIMEMAGWRVRGEGGAAQILGLKPTTLESRMQKLGIVRHK
jgi:PAS domain S-box-containing protein